MRENELNRTLYNPRSDPDNDWEWIELYNASDTAIDLSGWVVDDQNTTAFGAANILSGTIDPGGTAVLYDADSLSAADFAAAWGTGINLVGVTGWGNMELNNGSGGDKVSLWSDFMFYLGDNQNHLNSVVTAIYDGLLDDGNGSIFLSDLSNPQSWVLSQDAVSTPVGISYTSRLAGGNSGMDVGSPGGVFVPTPATLALLGLGLVGIGCRRRKPIEAT